MERRTAARAGRPRLDAAQDGACSLAPHIVLREAGLPFEIEEVSLADRKTASGADYRAINPKGYVPALQPGKGLAPPASSIERYQPVGWPNFLSTEAHKGFGPLFRPTAPDETKAAARDAMRAEGLLNE